MLIKRVVVPEEGDKRCLTKTSTSQHFKEWGLGIWM